MNCIYCGNPAGFLRFNHKECEDQFNKLLFDRDEILKSYVSGVCDKMVAQKALLEIAEHPYVKNTFTNMSEVIKAHEVIIRSDDLVSVTEYKNHRSMVRTGLSYARYPIYEEGEVGLGRCTVVITDKMINVIPDAKGVKRISLAMNKIINITTPNSNITVEIKTTSPVPHRVSLNYRSDLDSVFGLIKCFSKL